MNFLINFGLLNHLISILKILKNIKNALPTFVDHSDSCFQTVERSIYENTPWWPYLNLWAQVITVLLHCIMYGRCIRLRSWKDLVGIELIINKRKDTACWVLHGQNSLFVIAISTHSQGTFFSQFATSLCLIVKSSSHNCSAVDRAKLDSETLSMVGVDYKNNI